jgi:hypothetical protein
MNDSPVSAAVRNRLTEVNESLADVHMGVGVGDILDRARRRRARRRHGALAAAAGTGGSLALAGALLVSGGSAPAGHAPADGTARTGANHVQLTAWTVAKQPNGDIRVTIRELKDPAGLQRRLRADGVPASVSANHQNPRCRRYPYRLFPVTSHSPVSLGHLGAKALIVIRPRALPRGTGVQITFPQPLGHFKGLELGLVYASRGCTGS